MQELDFDHIQINLNPRACDVTPIPEDLKRELAYLGAIAERKKFAASLIVNLYNPDVCGADMYKLTAYCRNESCDTLRDGMMTLIQLCAYMESHEIYGEAFVKKLIKQWEFRR